jgi:hypothetical protein
MIRIGAVEYSDCVIRSNEIFNSGVVELAGERIPVKVHPENWYSYNMPVRPDGSYDLSSPTRIIHHKEFSLYKITMASGAVYYTEEYPTELLSIRWGDNE